MARKKKPVDRTPICDPAYVRRIDPRWMPGPVPFRFWQVGSNRRDYLLWLAHKQGLRTLVDLYRLNFSAYHAWNYGRGLRAYWGRSALEAVKDCFPGYDWKAWLFGKVPGGFWTSPANRRSYLDWLGERLGYRSADDWYEVSSHDFLKNRGKGILTQYRGSSALAVIDSIPGKWYEWKFRRAPKGFWKVVENRYRYLRWLGRELGFRRPEDWYRIQSEDIAGRYGGRLIKEYASLYDLLRDFLPQLDWDRIDVHRPIRVKEVLAWVDAHYARHGIWPTCQSGKILGTNHSWGGIDQCLRSGLRGLRGRTSLAKFLEKHRGVRVGRRPPHLSEQQILAWADAYFAAHGIWPTRESGPIPGTRETWGGIVSAVGKGNRGLRRDSTWPRLLARRRGVPSRANLPPLKEQQILTWARAYRKATGRWPSRESGPIAQSPENTWNSVDQALKTGARGLAGGLSLSRLLRKHGLK
ncbi:MAG: hypothetical protein ABSG53_06695 [Thermoguttaceae bacterium]